MSVFIELPVIEHNYWYSALRSGDIYIHQVVLCTIVFTKKNQPRNNLLNIENLSDRAMTKQRMSDKMISV